MKAVKRIDYVCVIVLTREFDQDEDEQKTVSIHRWLIVKMLLVMCVKSFISCSSFSATLFNMLQEYICGQCDTTNYL